MQLSTVSLLTAIIVGFFVFALGYAWGAFQKARGVVKVSKGSVPAARKGYWSAFWSMIKWGIGAVVIVLVLVTWTVTDVQQTADTQPSPAPSPSARR
jgi:ABC-type Fe3+ transport system permease subunit